ELGEDLAVDLEGDLLREHLGQLDLRIQVLVRGEVLGQLRRPLGLQLAALGRDADGLDPEVELGDDRHGGRVSEVRLVRVEDQGTGGPARQVRGDRVADPHGGAAGDRTPNVVGGTADDEDQVIAD